MAGSPSDFRLVEDIRFAFPAAAADDRTCGGASTPLAAKKL
jgi:hypothetical protein